MKTRKLTVFFTSIIAVLFFMAACNSQSSDEANDSLIDEEIAVAAVEMELDKTTYEAGEKIIISYNATGNIGEKAWIGIVPSSISHGEEQTNEDNHVARVYIKEKESQVALEAPAIAGSYDVRFNSDDDSGIELQSVTFEVTATNAAALDLDKATYKQGEAITVTFSAPNTWDETAWIGLMPAPTPEGDEARSDKVDYEAKYIEGETKGEMTFLAPMLPGNYSIRMYSSDKDGSEIQSVTFTVE